MDKLHLGVALPNYGEQVSPRNLVETLQVAESQGFDSAWMTDHVAVPEHAAPIYGNITEALVTLGFAIGHTTSLRLGTSALVVPQREPVLALKQLHSLDYLSGGRLVTVVAGGWIEEEFELLGTSFADRGRRLDGWLDLVRDAQQQVPGPIEHSGIVDMHRHWMSPAPARDGGLELWVAGGSAAALRRAAGLGTWHPVAHTPDAVREGAEKLRAQRPDAAVVHRVGVSFADAPDEDGRDERGRYGIAGPPDWIASRLVEHVKAGCTGFVVTLEVFRPGLAERIDRFAREVWPVVVAEQGAG
jgi:alkanesulfonate monooxygenase SsuD/methylene tetrahydromethanopterin reductase-like flavin-dependent oxidoreductase (luciferase family)